MQNTSLIVLEIAVSNSDRIISLIYTYIIYYLLANLQIFYINKYQLNIDNQFYMLAFNTLERLQTWSGDQFHQMDYVSLIGLDLTKGIDSNVFLCLNLGTEFYKEFSPDEIIQLKKIVARIDEMKS